MPCLPSHWPQAELTLSRDGRTMRFIFRRAKPVEALAATAQWGAQLLNVGQPLKWRTLPVHACFVIALHDGIEAASTASAATDSVRPHV